MVLPGVDSGWRKRIASAIIPVSSGQGKDPTVPVELRIIVEEVLDTFADNTCFFFQFPTKWMAPDLTAWMAFSGGDSRSYEWDALDLVKVRFVLKGTAAAGG